MARTKRLQMRLPKEDKEKLIFVARQRGVTMSDMVRQLIDQLYEESLTEDDNRTAPASTDRNPTGEMVRPGSNRHASGDAYIAGRDGGPAPRRAKEGTSDGNR